MPLYVHAGLTPAGGLNLALLLGSLVALTALGHRLLPRFLGETGLRPAILVGATLWSVCLVVITEGLSLAHLLAPLPSAIGWGMVTVVGAGSWIAIGDPEEAPRTDAPVSSWRERATIAAMLALGAVQAAWIAVTGYVYAPNNYDALTYHLPRVLHWVQDFSSGPYATNTARQVQFPTLAEYAVTQLHFVIADDSLANGVQWSALLLAAVAVAEVARRLGAGKVAQVGSGLLAISLPIGIAEAATTQNDFVVTAWLVVFAAFGIAWAEDPARPVPALLAGLALGLAVLTKSTAYVYGAPLLVMVLALAIRRAGGLRPLFTLVIAGFLTLAVNGGQYLRLMRTFGTPLGPTGGYHNDLYSLPVLVTNAIRNIALQVPLGGPLEGTGRALQAWLAGLNALTGFSPTDPRVTFTGASDVFQQTFHFGPDFAGNFVQLLLILAASAWLLRSGAAPVARLYSLTLIAAFVLFSAYLKFQIWGNRLELPLLVLWCPAIAAVLLRARRAAAAVPIVILLVSFNWTANSQDAAPGYGLTASRAEYYSAQPAHPEFAVFRMMAGTIAAAGCDRVGLSFSNDNIAEYPLWVMLEESGFRGRIEHVDVSNATARWADPHFTPCAVITDHADPARAAAAVVHRSGAGFELYLMGSGSASSSATIGSSSASIRRLNSERE